MNKDQTTKTTFLHGNLFSYLVAICLGSEMVPEGPFMAIAPQNHWVNQRRANGSK